jgi:hypothetical protein
MWEIPSVSSSSISVVSVPFEVTGDGPTISLGLMSWRLADTLCAEGGRKECGSGVLVDALVKNPQVSNRPYQQSRVKIPVPVDMKAIKVQGKHTSRDGERISQLYNLRSKTSRGPQAP